MVNRIGYESLLRQLSIADTLHSEDPWQVVDDWIDNYNCSAYYEPSYFMARSYFAGGFV